MKRALDIERFRRRVLVRPQIRLLVDQDGRLALDFVGRYEDLQASYDAVCDRIGLARSELPVKNRSDHRPYTDYYDDELRERVAEFYADDLAAFGYGFSERPDGLPGLAAVYGLAFADVTPMQQTLKYQAAGEGRVDVLRKRQGHHLEKVAIAELVSRRGLLETYQNRARFAFADSYDRAAKAQADAIVEQHAPATQPPAGIE